MHFVKERAIVICNELARHCKRNMGDITGFRYKDGSFFVTPEEAAHTGGFTPFEPGMSWGGEEDSHAWFTAEFTVPQDMDGKPLMFSFSTQERGWDATNPQFLFFLDGEPTQGLDTNHTDVLVSERAEGGRTYRLDLQAYSGRFKRLILNARYGTFNKQVYGLLMDIRTAVFVYEKQDVHSTIFYHLENAINDALNILDLRDLDLEMDSFLRSVDVARAYIGKAIYQNPGSFDVVATAIGHTHLDVAWWWTVEQTKEKAARSFATAVKLIEEYDAEGFKFMSSQPQLYKFIKERYPSLYGKIKKYVAEGRWEAEGGMWLEADCNLTSGESLVRQFLHGKNFFKREFGVDNVVLWLPDVFGYSAALPQVMKKSGIKYFMTIKISWNQFNTFPYDTFLWRGIDGTEVLTHLVTTPGAYQDIEKSRGTAYNGDMHPGAVIGAWKRYHQKGINNDVLISFGHGDGGGGPTRDMAEYAVRLKRGVPGAPRLRFEGAGTYFRELDERVADNRNLPKWVGELYLEYHRGTYTSMARNKRANRKLEFLLGELEFVSVWAEQRTGIAYPQEALLGMWENVLLNQFHDILPGSSVKEVYDVTRKEYDSIANEAEKLLVARAKALLPKVENGMTVLNTLHFMRDDVCVFDSDEIRLDALDDGEGICPVQKTHDGRRIAFVENIPSKGYKAFTFIERLAANNPLTIGTGGIGTRRGITSNNPLDLREKGIETPHFVVIWNEEGILTTIYDKLARREALKQGGQGNRLVVYEDKPMDYDNWDIDIYYNEKSWICDDLYKIRWLEYGPVRATLLIEREFLQSKIEQKIHFYADIRRIDFETRVDWKQHQCLLKAEFDVDVNASEATYDIQFGNLKRPTHFNTSWDMARFEVCGHKYADLGEGAFGVALLNDCKYGYGIHDGKMTLSLVKSGIEPNPAADQEEHVFTYAFMPHACGFDDSDVPEQAAMLNVPLRTVHGTWTGDGDKTGFVSVDAENIALETIKKSFDGQRTILRLHEYRNRRTEAVIRLGLPVRAVYETDLMEKRLLEIEYDGNGIQLVVKPFEIKTLEVEFAL